jgi:Icc protein
MPAAALPPRVLVQLSDPHITAPGVLAFGHVDTAAALQRAVQAVARLVPVPQAVLITGDLTEHGRPDEYLHLRALLRGLPCPVYLMPGNHDHPLHLRQACPDHPWLQHAGRAGGAVQYAVDLGGLRLVIADSVVPGAAHGALDDERLAQLDRLLADDRQTPTLLALHHPPFTTFIAHMDAMGLLQGAGALAALVARHPQVQRIVCGHLHRCIQTLWAGTLAMTAPSTAHQLALDLDPAAAAAYTLEPAGMLLHAWDGNGRLASHLQSLDGPVRAFAF